MKRALNDDRTSILVVIVCFIAYTLLGLSRNTYTAALAGIINDGVFTKTAAGVINSSFYITYSLSQILGSFYVDKISPFKIILFALIGTIIANIVMASSTSFIVIFTARSVTGLVQFGVWPACLKIVTEYISPTHRRKSQYLMPLGISVGTILSLLIASVVLKFWNWQYLFTVTYVLLIAITLTFAVTIFYSEKKSVEVVTEKVKISKDVKDDHGFSNWKIILSSGAIFMFIAAFANSLFGSGIASWLPTMIMESYNQSPSFSSALSMITTCSNFISIFVVIFMYPRLIKNENTALGVLYSVMLPLVIIMSYIGRIPVWVIVFLVILINVGKGAVHQFITVEIPAGYKKYNKAGMMAGLINVAACLGSMVAGTIYGYTSDRFGWNTTILIWVGLTFIALITSFIASPIWKKFLKKDI